jgi:hypothetical protein
LVNVDFAMKPPTDPAFTREIRDFAGKLADAAHYHHGKFDFVPDILARFPHLTERQARELRNYSLFEAMW